MIPFDLECGYQGCREQARWFKPLGPSGRRDYYCRDHHPSGCVRLPRKLDKERGVCQERGCGAAFLRSAHGGNRARYCLDHRTARHKASQARQHPMRMVAYHLNLLIDDSQPLVITARVPIPSQGCTYQEFLRRVGAQHVGIFKSRIFPEGDDATN